MVGEVLKNSHLQSSIPLCYNCYALKLQHRNRYRYGDRSRYYEICLRLRGLVPPKVHVRNLTGAINSFGASHSEQSSGFNWEPRKCSGGAMLVSKPLKFYRSPSRTLYIMYMSSKTYIIGTLHSIS